MATRNSSSMVRIGWTTESRPMCSANDCNKKEQIMKPNPISHTPRRMAWAIRLSRMVDSSRGVLDPHALEHAGQRIGKCRCDRKDIDHRLGAIYWSVVTDHAGGLSAGTQVLSAACDEL